MYGRFQWWLFAAACAASLVFFAFRAASIGLIYADLQVREQVRAGMERLADERGWFLSDLEVRSVGVSSAVVHYREHRRGEDPVECLRIDLASSLAFPCGS